MITYKIKDNDISKYLKIFDLILEEGSMKTIKRKVLLNNLLENKNSIISVYANPISSYRFITTKEYSGNVFEIKQININFKENKDIELELMMDFTDSYYGNIIKNLFLQGKTVESLSIVPRTKWNIVRYFELDLNI